MSDLTCTCRRYGYPSPLCPRHGRGRAGIVAIAAFYVIVVLAVVLTAHGGA